MKQDFDWFRDHHAENMERMFAAVSELYADYWNDFFHFALFESDEESWEAAYERTHRRYAAALGRPHPRRRRGPRAYLTGGRRKSRIGSPL